MKRTLVITGASKGIGLATATLFQEQGYQIVNISRSLCPLPNATQISGNLSDINWLAEHAEALKNSVEGSDSVSIIHCAAAHRHDQLANLDAFDFQQILQTNLIAPVQLSQLLLPLMPAGSSLLFLGSTLSEKAVAGACSYVTSKHAIIGMMRSSCQDLAGSGVHTACICPGFTDTEMLREHVGHSDEVLEQISQLVTFKRLIQPEEIAKTLLFCAENPVINGSVIHANLGQIEA